MQTPPPPEPRGRLLAKLPLIAAVADNATADNGATMCLIDGELICFSTATLTNPDRYNLTTYVRRGYLNSGIAAHLAGAYFVRLDGAALKDGEALGKIGEKTGK